MGIANQVLSQYSEQIMRPFIRRKSRCLIAVVGLCCTLMVTWVLLCSTAPQRWTNIEYDFVCSVCHVHSFSKNTLITPCHFICFSHVWTDLVVSNPDLFANYEFTSNFKNWWRLNGCRNRWSFQLSDLVRSHMPLLIRGKYNDCLALGSNLRGVELQHSAAFCSHVKQVLHRVVCVF